MRIKITRQRLKDELLFVAILVGLALALPLAAAMAFTTRVAFFVGLVVVAGGAVVYALSPAFRSWLTAWTEGKVSYSGIRLATGVAVDPAHAWMRVEDGELVVGADDLVQATLGPVEAVELPPPGTKVQRGEPLFRLRRGDREVAVRSPVTGTVAGSNAQIDKQPELINEAPFTRGWVVRLEAEGESPRRQRRSLLRGKQAKAWLRSEVDRLLATLLAEPAGVPTLPDGGILVDQLYRHIDDATWRRLNATLFRAEEGTASSGESAR